MPNCTPDGARLRIALGAALALPCLHLTCGPQRERSRGAPSDLQRSAAMLAGRCHQGYGSAVATNSTCVAVRVASL